MNDDQSGLEVAPGKSIKPLTPMGGPSSWNTEDDTVLAKKWGTLISSALKWLKNVRRDWVKANKKVQFEYPLNCRYGIAPNGLINNSLPDIYRLDKELGKMRTRQMIRLVEDGFLCGAKIRKSPA